MTSNHLKTEQAAALKATVDRHLRFLNKLCARMQALGFPPDDQLFVAAERARCSTQDLSVACHYAKVKDGVYR